MKKLIRIAFVFVVALALVAPAFAASSAANAEKLAQGFLKFEAGLKNAQAQVNAVLKSLNDVSTATGADVTKKYNTFAKEVKNMQGEAKDIKGDAADAQKARDNYMAAWQADQKKIQNPDLQKASEARRAELQPNIDNLKEALTNAGATAVPFLQDLTDLTLYLGNNLTPSGIAGASTLIQKCNTDGAKVNADIDTGIGALKALGAQVAPSVAK